MTRSNAQGLVGEGQSTPAEIARKSRYSAPTLRELGTVPELTHGTGTTSSEGFTKKAGT